MPALDNCHQNVVNALQKVGWKLSSIPFMIHLDKRHRLYIDIEARDSQQSTIFVVEVKCFVNPKTETTDLYTATGQYIVYRNILEEYDIHVPIYLAIPDIVYHGVSRRMAKSTIVKNDVKLYSTPRVRLFYNGRNDSRKTQPL